MTCVLLTSRVPLRCAGSAFGDTRYETDPLPWPLVGAASTIHGASLVVSHVQSRVVLTVSVPEAPDAGTGGLMELATET